MCSVLRRERCAPQSACVKDAKIQMPSATGYPATPWPQLPPKDDAPMKRLPAGGKSHPWVPVSHSLATSASWSWSVLASSGYEKEKHAGSDQRDAFAASEAHRIVEPIIWTRKDRQTDRENRQCVRERDREIETLYCAPRSALGKCLSRGARCRDELQGTSAFRLTLVASSVSLPDVLVDPGRFVRDITFSF